MATTIEPHVEHEQQVAASLAELSDSDCMGLESAGRAILRRHPGNPFGEWLRVAALEQISGNGPGPPRITPALWNEAQLKAGIFACSFYSQRCEQRSRMRKFLLAAMDCLLHEFSHEGRRRPA